MPRANDDPSLRWIGLKCVAWLWALPVLLLAAVLVCVADFWSGRTLALGGFMLAVLPLAAVRYAERRTRGALLATAVAAAGLFAAVTALLVETPAGPRPGSRVQEEFADAGVAPVWDAGRRLVAENDQLQFLFTTMPLVDSLFTVGQAARLKDLTAGIYRELEADPDFHALGSAMGYAYGEALGWRSPGRHAYVYVPRSVKPRAPTPVVVFFHGSGGNFKAYLWLLSRLADRSGFVLVAPSNGMGEWRGVDAGLCLDFALAAAGRRVNVDGARVSVVGLSNGGRAVTQLSAWRGGQISSMVFLSPVFDDRELHSASFAERARRRSMLIVTGALDDRVPLAYVERSVETMRRQGARVRFETLPDADHFLIFSHRAQVEALLGEWLGRDDAP